MGLTFNLGRVSPSVFTDSSLNVGIGAAPSGSYKLEVTGTAKVSSTLLVGSTVTINGASATTSLNVIGSGANGILLDQDTASAGASSRLFFKMNTQTYAMLADSNGLNFLSGATAGSSTGSPKMTITSAGNVGIGTSTPTRKFVVQDTSADPFISIMGAYPNQGGILFGDVTYNDASCAIRIDRTNNALWFSTSGASSERMRITSGGYLKASNNGSYNSSTGTWHELVQSSIGSSCVRIIATDSGYYDAVQQIMTVRTNNSAFSLSTMYTNNFGDAEFNLRGDGNGYADGSWIPGGADYAEYFEWFDNNKNNEDRRGYSVSLIGNKIKIAEQGEAIIGVISGNPSIIGDSAWNMWTEKYLRDDFGTYVRDENGDRILNPNYNPDEEYIPREKRPEWGIVGMVGKLCMRKGQPTMPNWIKMKDISDNVEQWLIK